MVCYRMKFAFTCLQQCNAVWFGRETNNVSEKHYTSVVRVDSEDGNRNFLKTQFAYLQ